MSRLTDLIRQAKEKDPTLGQDLEAEFAALSSRRQFGLNFERHQPEAVELPGRLPRKGDKVRVLPPRSSTAAGEQRLWKVSRVFAGKGTAQLEFLDDDGNPLDSTEHPVEDLVVIAEFRDPIYPGLLSTGEVKRGGDKPHHTVVNAENFHALQTLQFTHRGSIDAIYVDPPYNTGARDWKYNNDYVEGEDIYRHSKWLAFMERRLKLAKRLLKPENSVLIVTIDEKEYLRLGLLLEQTFPEANIQMVSSVINPAGVARGGEFARTDEYLFLVMVGMARPAPVALGQEWLGKIGSSVKGKLHWNALVRTGTNSRRVDRPNLFYPIYVDESGDRILKVGDPIPLSMDRKDVPSVAGMRTIWPMKANGEEANWQISPAALRTSIDAGYVKLGRFTERGMAISYLKSGERKKVETGLFPVIGKRPDGSVIVDESAYVAKFIPGTQWSIPSHDASRNGSNLLAAIMPDRKFPFPKSLYAVEDVLRFFVTDQPDAVVLDFFAGSGTTAHAVMRLNKQDGGRRQCISITNNEVSAEEQKKLRERGLRPGDAEWEALGICNYVTKPRVRAAITGQTPTGDPIKGDYKFTDEFPMAEGFKENVEFFNLTYESPWRVARGRAFDVVAPLLWMRAGSEGRRIDKIPIAGWDVADVYGVITDLDETGPFLDAVTCAERVRVVFIVTDDDRAFQSVCAALPERVEPLRLYESYLRNFEIKGRD